MVSILRCVSVLCLAACMSAGKHPPTLDYRSATADGAAVPAEQVRVVERPDALPAGMTWGAGAKPGDKLHLEPGYPTPEAPHRLVGAVAARGDDGRDALIAAARGEAGRHGANAILLVEATHTTVTALALWVSPAAPSERFPEAAELLRQPPPELEGYMAREQPIALSLAAPAPIQLTLKRGECLGVQLALAPDARLRGQAIALTRKDAGGVDNGGTLARDVTVRTRSVGNRAGCALADGPTTLTFAAGRPFGDGQALVQLYMRQADDAELAQLAARNQAMADEARERTRADDRRDCQICAPLLVRCGTPDRPASCQAYKSCLARKYVTIERCQR